MLEIGLRIMKESIPLVDRVTHPPAKAVPLFLEGNPCKSILLEGNVGNSPLEKGE